MPSDLDRRYVEHNFWKLDALADSVGASMDEVSALIGAGCAPGAIYALGADGWWSALSDQAKPQGEAWYSPGSGWGLRRAILEMRDGATRADAARSLARLFQKEFVAALATTSHAELAFPDCFEEQELDIEKAIAVAQREWAAWLAGGYGVCLRIFNGRTCVAKESLGASLKASLAQGRYDARDLLSLSEALAEIILPFAPWQRPTGTPGLTIDKLLDILNLGFERPYAALV